MITFYPGPSKVDPHVPQYVQRAYEEGYLSFNHRSPEFEKLFQETVELLQEKLKVPHDYEIAFVSSATECWEIIAQSLVQKSYHAYNGAFGKKWFNNTKKLKPDCIGQQFDPEELVEISNEDIVGTNLICLTQNETSNGTQIPASRLHLVREMFPDKLIALDATSSMAGITLDFALGDVWYASVQKCFGLPAGMAVLICSPRAVESAFEMNEANHYNSLTNILNNSRKWQTTHTPNVLDIYCLNKILTDRPGIDKINLQTLGRYELWLQFFEQMDTFSPFTKTAITRSKTVLAVQASPDQVEEAKQVARKNGIILGNGYGNLKEHTFRIANFPAIEDGEIEMLQKVLSEHFS